MSKPAPLKIGLVFDDSLDKPDGVQQYVLTIGRWLATQGHDVHYLVGETKRTDIPQLYSLARNIKVRFNQNRMAMPLPANAKAIRALLQREQFDVLHVQVPYSPALAGRVINAASPQTAVVGLFHVAPHGAVVHVANRLLGTAVRRSLKRFDALASTSTVVQQFAKQTFGRDSQVIPLPLQLDAFHGAKPFPQYRNGKHVVFLGRFVERKGCQYLLQAVAHAVHDGIWPTDAKVVLCGAGPLEARLKRYVADHHLQQLVEFAGYITEADKPRYLASADVVAYPSTGGEGFGIVLMEAMAASPGAILAGDNPGYASVMNPYPDSLFHPQNTAVFTQKLVGLLQDDDARAAAHAWQQTYVQQFDVAHVGRQTLDFYRQALHNRAG